MREPDPFLDSLHRPGRGPRARRPRRMLGVFDALHEAPAERRGAGRAAVARPARRRDAADRAAHARATWRPTADGRLRNSAVSERLLVELLAGVDRHLRRRPGRPALAGARACCPRRCATARRTRCTRSARTRRRPLGGLHPRPVRDLARRARGQRGARAGARIRAAWWTWRAATAASRWRCAAATRACGRPCSTCRRAWRWAGGSWRSRASPTGSRFARATCSSSDWVRTLDVVSVFNLIHHLPEERDRELCRMARAALRPGGCLVIGDSARPEPGEQVSEHGAISSLLFYAWSHSRNFRPSEIRGLDAGGRLRRGRDAPQRALAVAGRAWSADDPADRRHGHGRLGAAAPADRRGRAGPLPRARPAPAGRPARARADRARRPRRPALVSQRAARRRARWCTWPPPSATSRAPRSRS